MATRKRDLPRSASFNVAKSNGRTMLSRSMLVREGSKLGISPKPLLLPTQEFPTGPFEALGSGVITENARMAWCEHRLGTFEGVPSSCQADPDPSKPLYFWQLYSVLGKDRIQALVKQFYMYVFNDEEEWFRNAFVHATTMEMAVWSSSMFWLDAMGGGVNYHGGYHRTSTKHNFVREKITAEAAQRWMVLMRKTLQTADVSDDPRVKDCLLDFLEVHMHKYGQQYGFDASDISFDADGKTLDRSRGPTGCPF